MTKLKIAFATDDKTRLIDRHFGDAEFYSIYAITSDSYQLLKHIANTVDEEETHADPKKAHGISFILKEQDVEVVVNRAFGPNIKRIVKKFVPVLADYDTIEEAIIYIQNNFEKIETELSKGEERKHIRL
jgi:predicted Fe-Mo cluster-binding NifX family protein